MRYIIVSLAEKLNLFQSHDAATSTAEDTFSFSGPLGQNEEDVRIF